MPINIKTINVGDGDAHIITLKNEELTKIILIDGGKKNKQVTDKVLQLLDRALTENHKDGPDLIVCTHYDRDHIAGLIAVAKKYGNLIKECWMHTPPAEYGRFVTVLKEAKSQLAMDQGYKTETMFLYEQMKADVDFTKQVDFIIESYEDMQDLRSLLSGVSIIEPFVETNTSLEGFPEFKVVLPSKTFYDRFVVENKMDFLGKEVLLAEMISDAQGHSIFDYDYSLSVCDQLPVSSIKNGVTPVNMVSIVIQYQEEGRKYLFTGDAGIESFTHLSNYENVFKDVHFMTVPHHGSRYNVSKELVAIFNAETAFVSAAGTRDSKGNVKRPHAYVLGCYADHQTKVFRTQDCTDYLEFDEESRVIFHKQSIRIDIGFIEENGWMRCSPLNAPENCFFKNRYPKALWWDESKAAFRVLDMTTVSLNPVNLPPDYLCTVEDYDKLVIPIIHDLDQKDKLAKKK